MVLPFFCTLVGLCPQSKYFAADTFPGQARNGRVGVA